MKVIFDTNVLIDLYRNAERAQERLKELGIAEGVISTVTFIEFVAGAALRRKPDARKFIRSFHIIQFDAATHRAAELLSMRHVMKPKGGADFLIACIAKARNLTVLTENIKDFNFGKDVRVVRY